jgi:predicted DNA-binding WGR domain protein
MTQFSVTAVRLQYYDPRAGQRGSDKFYDTYTYQTPLGQAILVKRWGRVGTEGQHLVHQMPDLLAAEVAATEIRDVKIRKGYRVTASTQTEYSGVDMMTAVLAQMDTVLTRSAVASAVNEYRTQEKYGVTTVIEEDLI